MDMSKILVRNIAQLATPVGKEARHGSDMGKIRVIPHAAVYIEDGIIKDAGPEKEVVGKLLGGLLGVSPETLEDSAPVAGDGPQTFGWPAPAAGGASQTFGGPAPAAGGASQTFGDPSPVAGDNPQIWEKMGVRIVDACGHAVVPGFADSHTHFIFAGYRPEEFIMRLQGAGYMEIMKMGGGIRNTVTATRTASDEELYELGAARVREMLSQGITTAEGKSGYGLDIRTELSMLHVMEELRRNLPIDLAITYLGAHAVADEFKGDADGYVDFMISKVMPRVRKETEAEFCDVFCEDGVFSTEQTRKILTAAGDMGFSLKIHADEIVSTGGAELAAELGCVSADHLLAASEKGIRDLAASDTIATLLPCTAFCLGAKYADARSMIDAGCAVALASDYNPGSCFTESVPLMAALGAIQMHMTPEEVLTALTLNGAAALGRAGVTGSIEPGKRADLNILSYDDYRFLIYKTGMNVVSTVISGGKVVYPEDR